MKADPRFLRESGDEIFTGNELLVKGCLEVEGGTHLLTGYPGSPVASFFDAAEAISELLREHGVRATIANNEAHAVAMINGSQMAGLRAIAAFKSVGAHVASDALALGNMAGAHPEGGAVVVIGDDPWSESTQVPTDSRFICKHLMTPVLEPATVQEQKDWIDLAFKLSREAELYVAYLVTTNQMDGGGLVETRPNRFPETNTHHRTQLDSSKLRVQDMVLLPPRTWNKEKDMPFRVQRLLQSARRHGVNRILSPGPHPRGRYDIGFVSAGQSYNYLQHALEDLGVADQMPILKLGLTYPLDANLVVEFAKQVKNIFVVEERRGFIEEQIAAILTEVAQQDAAFLPPAVWGKKFPHGDGMPVIRGLNPSIVLEKLAPVLLKLDDPAVRVNRAKVEAELNLLRRTAAFDINIIPRSPTFCPGCPHRDSASVLMEVKRQFRDAAYMDRKHGSQPVDLVFHGDTGCYTMLMFEPTSELMHNYSGMGLGGATGAGIDPFITNKQVVFMGDSTFFHSGVTAISNSLKNGQDITYIILDNETTGMTGHQTTPGQSRGLMGDETFQQSIDRIVEGLLSGRDGHAEVVRANPAYRSQWRELLEETILKPGVKVVIADKECGITFHRREASKERATLRKKGFLPRKSFINVTHEVCEFCLECTQSTGCPGLTLTDTPYGTKVQTDFSWCVSDGACTKIKVCPSFEEVTILRRQKPASRLDHLNLQDIPSPSLPALSRPYRIYLAGIGGMGIGLATATLVRAAYKQGYDVLFCDKKGLAIRNGGVYSQITFKPRGSNHSSNIIPYGKADVIISVDILEAVRSLDPKVPQRVGSPDYTTAIVNTHKQPTIQTLLGRDDFDPAQLEEIIRRYTRGDAYFGFNASEVSERLFGTQIYANVIMLGIAFQRSLLPLTMENIDWAIRATVGGAGDDNIKAFNVGRKIVVAPAEVAAATGQFADVEKNATYEQVVADKADILTHTKRSGVSLADAYRDLVHRAVEHIRLDVDSLRDLALRIYDLIQYDGIGYAKKFIEQIKAIHMLDKAEHAFEATKTAISNLHRAMVIKDEIYVAHLLTSEEKHRRDRARYDVDPTRGDHIRYSHINRPHFDVLGLQIEFDMRGKQWQMRAMRHLKVLRRILPRWHKREKDFRDWYCDLCAKFFYHDPETYKTWLELLRLPSQVTGYRDVRYPKMEQARSRAAELLKRLETMQTAASQAPAPAPAVAINPPR
ncbi:MAG: 2-oxoacid:acceptor oxidoreductase family protein [Verrucomicrobia bacterium]|nr:2-oxoacid:acceptor oxidoreductase family protein [Verrucomicrobiota bacterium]